MNATPRPDDVAWLEALHTRLSDGIGTPNECREWIRTSKFAQPLSLNEAIGRLVIDPRRGGRANDTWQADVARLRHDCDNAIGWADMRNPPREWLLWASDGARR